MNLLISLTDDEEQKLTVAAGLNGLAPEEFAAQVLREHLPVVDPVEAMKLRIREWRERDKLPVIDFTRPRDASESTAALFEKWAQEDALLTNEERHDAEKLWDDYRRGIDEERTKLGMRTLF